MQIVALGGNLHEMSKPIFLEKVETYSRFDACLICLESGKGNT